MTILGFNPSHHGSVCLLEDGELKFFIQEERIGNREKYTPYPFRSFIDVIKNNQINLLTLGTPSINYPSSNFDPASYWLYLFHSFNKKAILNDYSKHAHHLTHIAHSFYNSGFKEAIGIVIDGMGSDVLNKEGISTGKETETVFRCSYPSQFNILYRNIMNFTTPNLSQIYETVTMHLGWSRDEAGKTMGLAPYGKQNSSLPPFFIKNKSNPDVFFYDLDPNSILQTFKKNQTFINEEKNPQLKLPRNPEEWHYDESKITDLEKDLAWKVQNDTQQLVGDYIEKATQETGLKQVCCAGGYFLNCVTNYYLLKRFPDIEFYFEPIANDAGTAIGSAKLSWHIKTQDTTIRPFKSLYLGKQYSKEELLEGIKKYVDTPQ